MITHTVPSRIGILGNPSDGYGGRTLALAVDAFAATVTLEESDQLEIVRSPEDAASWESVGDLVERVSCYGYLTGEQLLAATIRTFADVAAFAVDSGQESSAAVRGFAHARFRIGYSTSIPRQVGLAGSSALVIAALRCLTELVDFDIPEAILPSIALRVETEQLGLTAGLQDRVVQCYGGLVAMNFGEMRMDARFGVSHGEYHRLAADHLPPLLVAYRESAAEPSDNYHRILRRRFEDGDATIRETLHHLAGLALEGEAALRWNDPDRFSALIAENMRLRRQLGSVADQQLEMVEVADSCGCSSTFAGSGGAIIAAYHDAESLVRATGGLNAIGATVVVLVSTDG